MKQNEPLEISQVGNGFLVRGTHDLRRDYGCVTLADMLVFRSLAELQKFLAEHFTHRAADVPSDKAAGKR